MHGAVFFPPFPTTYGVLVYFLPFKLFTTSWATLSASENALIIPFSIVATYSHTRVDSDVAWPVLDYTRSSLIGTVKAQYCRCLPFP